MVQVVVVVVLCLVLMSLTYSDSRDEGTVVVVKNPRDSRLGKLMILLLLLLMLIWTVIYVIERYVMNG